jgi:hypothetical protein
MNNAYATGLSRLRRWAAPAAAGLSVALLSAVSMADVPAPPTAATRPRQAAVAPSTDTERTGGDQSAATDAPKFSSEAKWGTAGYNNNEIYYAVFVTDQDTRIIRCTTEIHGYYFENGAKLSISDRQITTVFPNQPTQVGIWMDMDQSSGATYAVKCHAI